MAKHPLLQKKADNGTLIPIDGRTREDINKVLEEARAKAPRLASTKKAFDKRSAERKYPDSHAGAIMCLRDLSTMDCDDAKAKPDPSVEGVWLVTCKDGQRAIVYLAGYKDPFGKIRPTNDFEDVEPEPRPEEDARKKTVKRMIKDLGPIKFTGKLASATPEQINAVLHTIKTKRNPTTDEIANALIWSHEKTYGILRELQDTGMIGQNKMRWNMKLIAHTHSWRHSDTCTCGVERCKGHGDNSGLRCNRPATEDGLCTGHLHQKFSGDTQECCGAFKPKHKADCQKYNENFDKTVNTLKELPKRGLFENENGSLTGYEDPCTSCRGRGCVKCKNTGKRSEMNDVEGLARQHKDHDGMCNLGDPVCQAYTDMRISNPGWHPMTAAEKKNCGYCDKKFTPKDPSDHYCSHKCQQSDLHGHEAAVDPEQMTECPKCGQPLKQKDLIAHLDRHSPVPSHREAPPSARFTPEGRRPFRGSVEDDDNPMCICGHPFYDHDEQGQIWKDANEQICIGFTPVEGGDNSVHLGGSMSIKFTAKFLRKAGGQEFWVIQNGKNAQDAYQKARREAEAEHGHQEGYSGEINSTYRMVMITPPKGIPPQQYAQMCQDYTNERDWNTGKDKGYPKSLSVSRQVEVKDGQKCPRCKTGTLTVTKREWQPGKFLADLKCSTPNCAINHNYRRDEKGRVFISVQRNIDTRRFPTLERDARLAQEKGNACCIALNSRSFLFFGIAPS